MRQLRQGSYGPAVEFLQLALERSGASIAKDGIFGRETEQHLLDFQKSRGLIPDGIAGPETHRALLPFYTGYIPHAVQHGETLYTLIQKYKSSSEAIELANPDLDPTRLTAGRSIIVPLPFPLVPTGINWSSYLLGCCVRGLSARYPFLTAGEIGRSVMGRPLWRLGIGSGKKSVLYNACHHANEWICTPLLMKFAEELAAAYAGGGSIGGYRAAELMSRCRIQLIPAVNPDGMDLVTGELQQGEYYKQALDIAKAWPRFPFPSGWKANIRGTDLNLQYPAGWEEAKKIKAEKGIVSPAPGDYVGPYPLSARESRALYEYTLALAPALTLAYHSQGRVIYWKYGDTEPPRARDIGQMLSRVSGYALEDTPYASGFAGYKDWYIEHFRRPGYTIEVGQGINPLPLEQFDEIYRRNLGILLKAADMA